MKIIVTGATGTVGSELVRQALADPEVEAITAIVRSTLPMKHPKLRVIVHDNFLNYDTLQEEFKIHDGVAWCLGISQSQVNADKYHEITYDFALAAAKAMQEANPKSTFLFVSGAGADTTEKSKTLFARIKGKTENALKEITSLKLFIIRPAGIKPIHKNPNTSFFNKLMIPLFPVFELLMPSYVIHSDTLARAILKTLKKGYPTQLIDNVALKNAGAI